MKNVVYAAVIILILVVVYFMLWRSGEYMTDFYLDQMAMEYSDPTVFIYTGDERDVLGMSARDYYLLNTMDYNNGVAPSYFEGDQIFKNQTGYLDMPAEYRPAPTTSTPKTSKPKTSAAKASIQKMTTTS